MDKFYGRDFYIDFNKIIEDCRIIEPQTNDEGDDEGIILPEINIFKYELIKMCVDRIINEFEDMEENNLTGGLSSSHGLSYQIAMNSLIKSEILIETTEDE